MVSENREQRLVDVVFIHGLWGDARETWQWTDPSNGNVGSSFWPKEMADELSSIAVWVVGYDSSPTKWVGKNMPLLDRANSILDLLDANGIGSRPVVFVTHSLGGLLAKAIVRTSHDTPVEHEKHSLHQNTRGFVFFSTPHTGSSIANLASCIPGSRPTEILTDLAKNDAYLRDLSQWFTDKARLFDFKCITYFESHKTKGVTVVDAVSANPNYGLRPVPYDGDHFEICKIQDASDHRYKQVLKFIRKIFETTISKSEPIQASAAIDGVDIEIGVLPNPPQDGRIVEFHPPSRTLTYTSRSSRETISIVPKMRYLEDAALQSTIDPVEYFWNPFKCQFPSLDVMLVNNSSKTLVLSEATLEVASSRPDFSPVIVIPSNTWDMKLVIKNEGWGKISNAVLRCNLLPTSAREYMPDPPINDVAIGDEFAHEFTIGDFAESAEVNLRETLRTLGVNIEAIENAPKRSQIPFVLHAIQTGGDIAYAKHMGRFPDMENSDAWTPFPDGYVVVAGRLEFDSVNDRDLSTHFSLPVRARVFMFSIRFDQPMPPSYQYSAELEHTGRDYEVPVKLCQTLKAGEADRFTLRLSCTQSSFHQFRIRWKFVGGMSCLSYNVKLQHFVPRTFARETSERVDNSVFDPEISDGQSVFPGDCVEQSLMMAMSVAQAMTSMQDPQR